MARDMKRPSRLTVDGHGDAAALAHHVPTLRQLGQVALPSRKVLGAHGGTDRAAEVVQDDRHACRQQRQCLSRIQLSERTAGYVEHGGCGKSVHRWHATEQQQATASSKAAVWRVRAWEAAGEVRDAWEAVVVPLLRRGLPAAEQLSLT